MNAEEGRPVPPLAAPFVRLLLLKGVSFSSFRSLSLLRTFSLPLSASLCLPLSFYLSLSLSVSLLLTLLRYFSLALLSISLPHLID